MKQTITVYDFRDAFNRMGRGEQFSYEALGAIFEYLEQYEEDCGTEIELDPIAVCCDFAEYTAEDLANEYSDYVDDPSEATLDDWADALNEHTSVVGVVSTANGDTLVFQQF